MNYNSLRLQIQNYSNRTDQFFIDQIPDFINQGVNRIYSEAKSIGFEKVLNGNLVLNNPLLAKPADWKETVSFSLIDNRLNPAPTSFLLLRSLEFCKSYWPKSVLTRTPEFYANALEYNNFFFAPTPDYAYPLQLIYLALPLFNAQNPENFLTLRYPSLLLYACLLETIPFLKDDERVQMFEALYSRALQSVNKDAQKLYTDRISKRDKD